MIFPDNISRGIPSGNALQVGFSMRLFKCRQNLQKLQLSRESNKNVSYLAVIFKFLHFYISSQQLAFYIYNNNGLFILNIGDQ